MPSNSSAPGVVRNLVNRAIPAPVRKQLRNFRILSRTYGQYTTMRRWSCVDASGQPVPWYTYPATEYLSSLDFSAARVFEYGSGNSSLWWAGRCRELVSVESDAEWYDRIRQDGARLQNFNYLLETDKSRYVRQELIRNADVVIIDGLHRTDCADWFLARKQAGDLNPALLIFDNSDWYPGTMQRLYRELDWPQVDFSGFGPINDYTWITSLFINPDYKPRLGYRRQLRSMSGLTKVADDDRQ